MTTVYVDPVTSTRHAEEISTFNEPPRPRKRGGDPSNPLDHLKNTVLTELQVIKGSLMNIDTSAVINRISMVKKVGVFGPQKLSNAAETARALLIREKELEATLSSTNRIEAKRRHLRARTESRAMPSEPSAGTLNPSVISHHENVTDVMGNAEIVTGSADQQRTNTGQKTVLSMDEFFSRPVPLDTFDILLNTDLDFSLDVWDVYTSQPSVRAKLRNYTYLKADLHIKIAISGSPFHYGKILVSYQPYAARNKILTTSITNYAAEPNYRPLLLNYLSQAPGAAVMDVKDNMPLHVECPFLSPNPMHRLFNASSLVLSDVTSYDDLANAGTLYMYGLNRISSVSASPSDVSVYIYGWLSNVELGPPTGTQIAITTESRVMDERETGPVEKTMTTASVVAESLSSVPQLGPYARASSLVFRGMSKLASLMGWSVPPLLNESSFVKNQPFMNGAQTIGVFTGKRLTIDPKQELVVDPRCCASTEDDMVITAISKVDSYLRSFTWSPSDVPLAGNIFISPVTPNLNTVFLSGLNYFIQPTAMSFAAMPFRFWRGTVHFRFEVVASQFHRGKLAFYYEPNCWQNALIDGDLDTNKQFIQIIDIQETQSIEFTIGWAFHRDWCQNDYSQADYPYGPTLADFGTTANGYIAAVPFTSIQSPDDSDVTVNVYVSCPDLQVNYMYAGALPTSRVTTESRTLTNDMEHSVVPLNVSVSDTSGIASLHFGEQPISYRSLMKRYVTVTQSTITALNSNQATYLFTYPVIPSIAPQVGSSSITYATLFSYLRYAYLGIRGGVRYRWVTTGQTNAVNADVIRVSLSSPSSSTTAPTVASSALAADYALSSLNGTVTFISRTNTGVEFEVPMYTSNKFLFSFADNLVGTNATDEMCGEFLRNFTIRHSLYTSQTSINQIAMLDIATGEDFSFIRFQGAPYYTVLA